MEIQSLSIQNFKGIKKAHINFAKCPNANVFTLVGPNECGKTTVLEAIHSLKSDMDNQAVLIGVESSPPDRNVPISQRGSFTGEIEISILLSIAQEEIAHLIESFQEKFSEKLKLEKQINTIEFSTSNHFEAGDHNEVYEYWNLKSFSVESAVIVSESEDDKKGDGVNDGDQKSPKNKVIIRKLSDEEENFLYEKLNAYLPKILYFPNLLSRFPEKIYLDQADNPDAAQREMNIFYLKILQDVLTQSRPQAKLTIQKQIHERLKNGKDTEHEMVRSLLDSMGARITSDI